MQIVKRSADSVFLAHFFFFALQSPTADEEDGGEEEVEGDGWRKVSKGRREEEEKVDAESVGEIEKERETVKQGAQRRRWEEQSETSSSSGPGSEEDASSSSSDSGDGEEDWRSRGRSGGRGGRGRRARGLGGGRVKAVVGRRGQALAVEGRGHLRGEKALRDGFEPGRGAGRGCRGRRRGAGAAAAQVVQERRSARLRRDGGGETAAACSAGRWDQRGGLNAGLASSSVRRSGRGRERGAEEMQQVGGFVSWGGGRGAAKGIGAGRGRGQGNPRRREGGGSRAASSAASRERAGPSSRAGQVLWRQANGKLDSDEEGGAFCQESKSKGGAGGVVLGGNWNYSQLVDCYLLAEFVDVFPTMKSQAVFTLDSGSLKTTWTAFRRGFGFAAFPKNEGGDGVKCDAAPDPRAVPHQQPLRLRQAPLSRYPWNPFPADPRHPHPKNLK